MSRPFDRLIRRLRLQGLDVPDGLVLRRTRAGHHQRSAGAWSWWAEDARGREVLAGFEPVSVLAALPALAVEGAEGTTAAVIVDAE